MARAKRHFIPGYIWHITHRCHKREFLLKFSKDRHRYLQWLHQARKRYGLAILNYMVTSNHVHLLVADTGKRDVIPKSMQLVAGRTGQEYNQRKHRKGVYWEDRYHATAVSKAGITWHDASPILMPTWSVLEWSDIHQCCLLLDIMRSSSPAGRTS